LASEEVPARTPGLDPTRQYSLGNYLPPPAVPDLPGRIPPTLIPPPLVLTPKQQFFAGGWLSGIGLLQRASDRCQLTISFETPSGSGVVDLP
jgi:hypothetical protein